MKAEFRMNKQKKSGSIERWGMRAGCQELMNNNLGLSMQTLQAVIPRFNGTKTPRGLQERWLELFFLLLIVLELQSVI